MKKPLVIFGSGDIAQLAHYYFSMDSNYEVVAFTVDANYIKESEFCRLLRWRISLQTIRPIPMIFSLH